MAVSWVALLIFLVPVVGSLLIGTLVLGEILKDPERELNVFPFQNEEPEIIYNSLKITYLQNDYSINERFIVK